MLIVLHTSTVSSYTIWQYTKWSDRYRIPANHWFFHSVGAEAWIDWIVNRKTSTFFKEPNCKATRHPCGWAFEVILQWRWGAQRWHNEMLPFGRISFLWLNSSIELTSRLASQLWFSDMDCTRHEGISPFCWSKQCVWGVYRTCQIDTEPRQSRPRPLRGWLTLLAWLVLPLSRILEVMPASGQLFTYLGRLTFLHDLHAPPFPSSSRAPGSFLPWACRSHLFSLGSQRGDARGCSPWER